MSGPELHLPGPRLSHCCHGAHFCLSVTVYALKIAGSSVSQPLNHQYRKFHPVPWHGTGPRIRFADDFSYQLNEQYIDLQAFFLQTCI